MSSKATDERKARLLEKYTREVERSVRRTKNSASHLHTRRFADAALDGDLRPFWANEICTHLITREDAIAVREAMYAKYGIAD